MISPRVESLTGTSSVRSPPSQTIPRVLVILGTRPEAIKLAPLVSQLKCLDSELQTVLCVTGQHRSILDQALRLFDLSPDFDLSVMQPGQSLTALTSRLLTALEPVIANVKPDITVVQGDTTSTLCGALASFYAGIPVAHVEAGLRTFDLEAPFPEEMNRAVLTMLATLHFAPTEWAAGNLRRAGVAETAIHITGNTAIDAVLEISRRLDLGTLPGSGLALDPKRKLIVVTAHRRENAGRALEQICAAITQLAHRADIEIVWPVHPSPLVQPVVHAALAGKPNVHLVEPVEYAPFVDLLRRAHFVITDSGGIQEEGPSLGKPILVLRDGTERPEAVTAGTVKLVGSDPARIVSEANRLLEDPEEYNRMSQIANPYGDGQASRRIASQLRNFLHLH